MWLTCLHCGGTYFGSGQFCTSKCEENFLNPPVPKFEKKNRCRFCGQQILKGFYCSNECKKENGIANGITRVCQNCSKTFLGNYYSKYCDELCRKEGFRKNRMKTTEDKQMEWAELKEKNLCRVCKKDMPLENVDVCSRECAVAFGERE